MLLRPLILALAAVLLLSLFSGEVRDTDIWLALKTGQHTIETRRLTVPDPFSYATDLGAARYPGEESTRHFNLTHEWLAQSLMYVIYSLSGFAGLVLIRALLLAGFCALAGWIAFQRGAGFAMSLAAAFAAAGVAFHFQQSRPFLVTFLGVAATMAILESRRRLWLLPPLFLIWANCHGGFFMGWLVCGAYCAEVLIRRLRGLPDPDERRLWLVSALCFVVSALNPNGFGVIRILFYYRTSAIQSANLEWQRPIFWEPGIYSFLLFGSLIVLALARRRTRPVDWLLYLGFAALSLVALRNVIFMGLIGPLILVVYAPRWRFSPAAAALAAAALIGFDLVPAIERSDVFALRAAEWQLPTGAADFIQKHQISARMFNSYESGGYLVWRLWPLQRDFIDPRGLSEEAFADYRRILYDPDSSGEAGAEKLFQKYGIEMLVIEGFDYPTGQVYPLTVELAESPRKEWKLVYADSGAVIFMRHPPPGVTAVESADPLLASLESQCAERVRHDPSRPRCARGLAELYAFRHNVERARYWMASYFERRKEPDPEAERINQSLAVTALNDQGLSLEEKGDLSAAEPLFRRAAEIANSALGPDHPDTAGSLNNLASLLEAKGDYAAAETLYRRALAIAEKTLGPTDPRTAMSLDNLAGVLEARGDRASAELLYRRALEIAEKSLGPGDQTTLQIREDLNGLLRKETH